MSKEKVKNRLSKKKIIAIIIILMIIGFIADSTSISSHANTNNHPTSNSSQTSNSQTNNSSIPGVESNFNAELILASQTAVRKALYLSSKLTFPNEFESQHWSIIHNVKNHHQYTIFGTVKDDTNNTTYSYAALVTHSDNNQHYTASLEQLYKTSSN